MEISSRFVALKVQSTYYALYTNMGTENDFTKYIYDLCMREDQENGIYSGIH